MASSRNLFFLDGRKIPGCPGCGVVPQTVRLDETRQLLYARKYVNHSRTNYETRGIMCRCDKFAWYYGKQIETNPRVGRPRLGKTHQRSQDAKRRRNERRNKKRKLLGKVHWTSSIVDGQLVKDKIRPGKPVIRTVCTVPSIVAQAIVNLSNLPAVKPVRKPRRDRVRTPRRRTRSEQIERLQKLLEQQDVMNDIKRWDRINMALEEEYLLQARRDVHENLDGSFQWHDTAESVYAQRFAKRAESGTIPGRAVKKRYGFMLS